MNKKQLIVAWIMAALIVLALLFPSQIPMRIHKGTIRTTSNLKWMFIGNIGTVGKGYFPYYSYRSFFHVLFSELITVLLFGGLLIYTLRDKK
jgi:hypothetical protein